MSGSTTVMEVYAKAKSATGLVFTFIFNFPSWVRGKIYDAKLQVAMIRRNLQNFYKTNLDLGLHHLHLGNINDAIFRFKMIDKFIVKGDKKANYYLGWCYFLKNNEKNALHHLKLSGVEDEGLANFITNAQSVLEVPQKVWKFQRELTAHLENQKWTSDVANLPHSFINILLDEMETLPKECRILDLGCSSGLIGKAIGNKLKKNYHLTGVEELDKMLEIAKCLKEDNRTVYDDLKNESISDFLKTSTQQYDIITSFNSLTFIKNLTTYLEQIYRSTKPGGYFIISLPTATETSWNKSMKAFVYKTEEIENQLKLVKFDLVDIKELVSNKLQIYAFFICKKQNTS